MFNQGRHYRSFGNSYFAYGRQLVKTGIFSFGKMVVLTVCILLFSVLSSFSQQKASSDTVSENYINGVFKKIFDEKRFVSYLSGEDIPALPLGLVKEIGGKTYVIAIESAKFTDRGNFFNAYFQCPIPGTPDSLVFGARDVAFTPGGIAASSSTKLVLLKNKTIPFNEHVDLSFPGDGSNYIEWDCNGFKAANLHGEFAFDPGWIQPEDPSKKKVQAGFQVNVHDLHNIMASISIPAFKISGLPDFSFTVKNATLDMSDIANPSGLMVTSDMLPEAGNPNLWRGFYLQELEVGLPQQLATQKGRPKVTVSNFYIDDQGVSGNVTGSNIVSLGDASAGGWPLSVDKIGLSFSKNKLNGGTLGGLMAIDFLGDDPLRYEATVNLRNNDTYYAFSLQTTEDKTYPFFAGEIMLAKNSRIEVAKTTTDFIPTAILNGKVALNKSVLNISDISFQDLTLSTQRPYLHKGVFDASSNGKSRMSNFPIGFDDLHIGIDEGLVGIGATVRLNFMNSEDKGFAGQTSFIITAVNKEEQQTVTVKDQAITKTRARWKIDKVKIDNVILDVKVTAFKLHGELAIFDNHPVYGNGFRGSLSLSIPGPIPNATATAYFGSKDDYKYWHVDAYIGVTVPIPPALVITGMLGGMSYHMERPPQFDPYSARNAIDKDGGIKNLNEIFLYVPNKEAGLGFMGGVSLAFAEQTVINVNVGLEVQFGTDGGFRYAQFDGAGYVMHEPKKAASQQEAGADESAPVWVRFYMRYDNTNHSFDASAKTYVNIAGVLKGVNDRGLVGELALHIASDDWWFYIGRPSEMFGLSIAGLAEVKSYFMMGTKVEDMPPPPQEVAEVFDNINTNFMAVENAMSTGKGFGFGAHFRTGFKFDYGVYGEFAIGAGADILLRNYGNLTCKGSNSPIGFNGWYASGQAYAFLKGDVGIRVKILGKKRGFSIAQLSAAVLLQGKAPNPSWFRGMVGVKYSVLGGLIKGKANIKVELGTQCEIVGAKEIDILVISDIKPDDHSNGISVFATPQVAFNMAVGKAFSMMNDEDKVETYQVQLDEFRLFKDKTEIANSTTEIAADGMSASLKLRDVLPGVSNITAQAKVHIEKQIGSTWQPLKNNTGVVDYETKVAAFTTGEEPDNIQWENVAYAYPVRRQYNFYPEEYGKGYIKLKQGQPNLFKSADAQGKKWNITASFNTSRGAAQATVVSYDDAQTQVNFNIPTNLSKETIYSFTIQRTPLDAGNATGNVTKTETTSTNADGDSTTIASTSLKDVATAAISKEVINCQFRTSHYLSFTEKMNAMTNATDLSDIATNYTVVLGQRFDAEESFDKYELQGDAVFATKPLIYLQAGTNCEWLQNKIMPLLYNGYPFAPSITLDRAATNAQSIAPLDAVRLYNNDNSFYTLEDAAISEGIAQSKAGRSRFMYYLSYQANDDYHDLLNKASRYQIEGRALTPQISKLLLSTFPDIAPHQYYPVQLQYRLPGTNKITSTVERSIYYQ